MAFDSGRLRPGDWLTGIGAVALFIFMFFFNWYGLHGANGAAKIFGVDLAINGWHGHSVLRWFMLATLVLAVVLVALHGMSRTLQWPIAPSAVLAGLAALTTILIAYRVILNEPGPNGFIDVKIGAWLGLFSLIAITAGAYQTMGADGVSVADARSQARGVVDDVTSRASAAQQPAAPAPAQQQPPAAPQQPPAPAEQQPPTPAQQPPTPAQQPPTPAQQPPAAPPDQTA